MFHEEEMIDHQMLVKRELATGLLPRLGSQKNRATQRAAEASASVPCLVPTPADSDSPHGHICRVSGKHSYRLEQFFTTWGMMLLCVTFPPLSGNTNSIGQ